MCRDLLNDIIFGDLNINMRSALIRASLAALVAGTHQILAMNTGFAPSAPCIFTRYNDLGGGTSSIDFAMPLIPMLRTSKYGFTNPSLLCLLPEMGQIIAH